MRYKSVRKTDHYRTNHESEVPWSEVVHNLFKCKYQRKVGDKVRIVTKNCYILGRIKDDVLYVVNAKRR